MQVLPTTIGALAFATCLAAAGAYADSPDTPCKRTANDLRQACGWDAAEERRKIIANCRQFSDTAERKTCRNMANAAVPEALEDCDAQFEARTNACTALNEGRYDPDPLTNPALEFVDPEDIGSSYPANPYVSLVTGRTLVLRGGDEFEEIVVVYVTDEVREIQGVECRVVTDVVLEIGEDEDSLEYFPVEVTDDWFAQSTAGDVYYCGEAVRDFEDGVISSIDGAFEAGKDFAKAGLLMPSLPTAGQIFRTEFALDEAEDIVEILALAAAPSAAEGGENPALSCADNGGCLRTEDSAPLDPESTEYKYYLAGVGFVLAVDLEDGELTGGREELVCHGDSLSILSSPDCGIEEPQELLEELCELNPEAFCD